MKKVIIYAMFLFTMMACGSEPLDHVYDEKKSFNTVAEIAQSDSAVGNALLATLIRYQMSGTALQGKTYRQIYDEGFLWIEEQKRIEQEEETARQRAIKHEQDRVQRLRDIVIVTCIDKGFTKANYSEYITYTFAIENLTDRPIKAVKGGIKFTDLFDELITKVNFTYDENIPAKTIKKYEATTNYNSFDSDDNTLRGKSLENLKVSWMPEKIIFEDGTIAE